MVLETVDPHKSQCIFLGHWPGPMGKGKGKGRAERATDTTNDPTRAALRTVETRKRHIADAKGNEAMEELLPHY